MKLKGIIKSYKGFNNNLTCRGFQYEIGKDYSLDGNVQICERGFHACENPLDVMGYYFMDDNGNMARFCEVEQSGDIERNTDGSDTKVASSKIHIKAELKFADIVKLGIEWIKEQVEGKDNPNDEKNISSSGYYAKIGSSGDYAQIGSSGDSAQINSTGEDSVICCAGHNSQVRAKKGSWITLAEWVWDEKKERNVPKCVKTEYVDGKRIKADTFYKLVDGEFIEVE